MQTKKQYLSTMDTPIVGDALRCSLSADLMIVALIITPLMYARKESPIKA